MKLRATPGVILVTVLALGCAPINPSPKRLVGTWRAEPPCGTEILELRADSTYTQRVLKPDDNLDTHQGRWSVEPSKDRLVGARVMFHGPIHYCLFGKQKTTDELGLTAYWEWGRTVLEWNPDEPGYMRVR